eukprot:NODE_2617_length_2179_cov_5.017057.p1 GENE.NODE_2617_length_2179_cov_5.017057~~NODE_2617_length_2179_cov_5.017057.p1  ORF type:complete len:636 (-),score=77.39 NODE_2617_length_2179_cov_5.017057:81-1988(-)
MGIRDRGIASWAGTSFNASRPQSPMPRPTVGRPLRPTVPLAGPAAAAVRAVVAATAPASRPGVSVRAGRPAMAQPPKSAPSPSPRSASVPATWSSLRPMTLGARQTGTAPATTLPMQPGLVPMVRPMQFGTFNVASAQTMPALTISPTAPASAPAWRPMTPGAIHAAALPRLGVAETAAAGTRPPLVSRVSLGPPASTRLVAAETTAATIKPVSPATTEPSVLGALTAGAPPTGALLSPKVAIIASHPGTGAAAKTADASAPNVPVQPTPRPKFTLAARFAGGTKANSAGASSASTQATAAEPASSVIGAQARRHAAMAHNGGADGATARGDAQTGCVHVHQASVESATVAGGKASAASVTAAGRQGSGATAVAGESWVWRPAPGGGVEEAEVPRKRPRGGSRWKLQIAAKQRAGRRQGQGGQGEAEPKDDAERNDGEQLQEPAGWRARAMEEVCNQGYTEWLRRDADRMTGELMRVTKRPFPRGLLNGLHHLSLQPRHNLLQKALTLAHGAGSGGLAGWRALQKGVSHAGGAAEGSGGDGMEEAEVGSGGEAARGTKRRTPISGDGVCRFGRDCRRRKCPLTHLEQEVAGMSAGAIGAPLLAARSPAPSRVSEASTLKPIGLSANALKWRKMGQ